MPFDPWSAAGLDTTQAAPATPAAPAADAPPAQPTWTVLDPQGRQMGLTTDPKLPGMPQGYTLGPQITAPPPKPGTPAPPTTAFGGPPPAPTPQPPPPGGSSSAAQPPAPAVPPAPAATRPEIPVSPAPAASAPTKAAPAGPTFDPWKAAGLPDTPSPADTPPVKADGSSAHSDEPWYQHLGSKVADTMGAMASGQGVHEAAHNFTLGFDDIVGPLVPAIASTITSGDPSQFTQHYEDARNSWVQAREQYEREHPVAADLMAGLGMVGSMAIPFGAAARGATLAARLGRGIATGAGVGAAGGFGLTEGDPLTAAGLEQRAKGAVIGGVTGAALAPVAEAVPAIARTVGGIVRPTAQAPRLAGQVLTEAERAGMRPGMGGGPLVPQPSPVRGVPLNLAEATGSPEIAALTDQRYAANRTALVRHRNAQNVALRSRVPGVRAGEPTSVAAERSAAAEDAIRRAARIARSEERRLWERPSLSRPSISTGSTKAHVNDLAADIRTNEPGLNTDALNNPSIQSVIRAAQALPDRAAANQINGIASQFGRIARNHTLPGEVRAVAGRLQRAAQDGLMDAPEVAGRPPLVQPRGWHPDHSGNLVWHNGGVSPAIHPDPQLVRDMRIARDFTKRKADVFGHANFESIWQRNSSGNLTLAEGEGLGKFFNFKTGTMKPGQIKDVGKFMDDISTEWSKLGHTSFDPADADQVRNELVENTRDFITARLLDNVSHPTNTDDIGERMLQFGKLRTAIATNRRMLLDSGVYTPAQLDMWDRIADTAQMIHTAQQKGTPIGSPTYSRLISDHRFMDALLGGPIRRFMISSGAGTALGAVTSHLLGAGEWGGAVGGEVAGLAINSVLEHFYAASREEALHLIDQALNDPQIAQDLMQRAGRSAQWSEATRKWIAQIMAISSAHVGANYAAPPVATQ